ncbi:C25 family cysteine peptidase [Paraflavitalea pollutisoli]|uniref:putative type IX secretion system sortase PorU2 n=1 Tax=Paraflavitalea pollutisoli TaxID=3034143 RepID=UPI0023EC8834|nr:C25 family cysteine peptidase [Paraflavitalea sp. H1-2-19X]
MKRIYTLLLMLAGLSGMAQSYNNEWIKFNQTYYKFKVGTEGLLRISQATLNAAGLGGTAVQNLELWRNGEKVPFYTTVPTGPLPGNGYIEFWAKPNDGKPDKAMYLDPLYQHTDHYSLVTDTAVYFLSANTDQSGIRYQDVVNNVTGPVPPVEPYFMYTAGNYLKAKLNQGFAVDLKEYLYSSSFDKGEYWSSSDINPSTNFVASFTDLKVYSGGPDATLRYGASGNSLNSRSVRVALNGNTVREDVMDYFNDVVTNISIPSVQLASNNVDVKITNASAVSTDRMVVSHVELTYARQFRFGNARNFSFKLPARAAGYFLNIKEFDYGSTPPVLYDRALGERYVADITTTPGSILFALPGSAVQRDLVLVNVEAGNIGQVAGLTPKTFIDYTKAVNQGTYLIITHPSLFIGTTGNNPVNDYKNYRESAAGGGYRVLIADIDELVDQFAFSIRKHPLSVRNFIQFANAKFQVPVKNVFLIGRGMTYYDFRRNITDPVLDKLNIIPTFGNPGSDNLLSSATPASSTPVIPIGRLSVVHPREIEDYLVKVKEYEQLQMNAPQTIADRAWTKNVVQVTGSSEAHLGSVLCNYMGAYKQMIEDVSFGAKAYTFCKISVGSSDQFASDQIARLFKEGIGFLNYFGHSSATTLEFNLDNPQNYENGNGKYPVFFVNGCNAGNFFTYYPARFTSNETLSEKFVLAKQKGSIAFVASTHFGIVNYLNNYLVNLYKGISTIDYNKTLGETLKDVFGKMREGQYADDYYSRIHAEQITLHGDPALRLQGESKPDYVVEQSSIKVNPAFISIADNFVQVKSVFMNLGRAIADSIVIQVKQQYPTGASEVVYRQKHAGINYKDSLTLFLPIIATRDKGKHTLTVSIDDESVIDEVTKSNNIAVTTFDVFEDEARPAYPYNFSIVNDPVQKLYSSTANPFSLRKDYVIEVDTTEGFNSAQKKSSTVSATGGVIEYDPQLTYKDSTVYYWRIAPVPASGETLKWINQSFTYLKNVEGYGQSHYFQFERATAERMYLDTADRIWKYGMRKNKVYIKNCIFGPGCDTEREFVVAVNDADVMASACVGNSLIFHVFDSITFKPWKNVDENGADLHRFGSGSASCQKNRNYNFEFSYMNPGSRKLMMDFMDSIPKGSFVIVKSVFHDNPNSYVQTWMKDTLIYGSNKSLYHKLLEAGFVEIDSINSSRAWAFVYKKGDMDYVPRYEFGKSFNGKVGLTAECYTKDTLGFVTSPMFGPAKSWESVQWDGKSLEQLSGDRPSLEVIGISKTYAETTLYTLQKNDRNLSLSSVDANMYPYMKLRLRNLDSISVTPYQLKYWHVKYKPAPEGSFAANLYLKTKDTVEIGEPIKFGIAFKNISKYNFDSLDIKATITDKDNVAHEIKIGKQKKVVSGDTLLINLELPSKEYVGNNTVYIEVNPDGDEPEQYHFNNFMYKTFYVKSDNSNPLLDVTFDGVHILNRDIVSARPHVRIQLKDEAKHMLLDDTSLVSVQVRYPDRSTRFYKFDNDTLRFTPATNGSDNAAVIDFTPAFINQIKPEGDEYELIVTGKDKSGNKAGTEYRVAFKVINKAMISNLLNYPNPFSTSTAFVFTLTGSEIPQNLKIQVLTVTGKIVREITINELGPLRIGRNITEFKWDGTDQFGQKLANGVYLYRVVTSLNGKSLDKYKTSTDNTDKFFTNGYGKMYLMR